MLPLYDAKPTTQHIVVLISLDISMSLFVHCDDYLTTAEMETHYRMNPS